MNEFTTALIAGTSAHVNFSLHLTRKKTAK